MTQVGVAFLPKAEHGGQRRQADTSFPQPDRIEPRLVEFEPRGQHVGNRLMQARHEDPSNATFSHALMR